MLRSGGVEMSTVEASPDARGRGGGTFFHDEGTVARVHTGGRSGGGGAAASSTLGGGGGTSSYSSSTGGARPS